MASSTGLLLEEGRESANSLKTGTAEGRQQFGMYGETGFGLGDLLGPDVLSNFTPIVAWLFSWLETCQGAVPASQTQGQVDPFPGTQERAEPRPFPLSS